VYLLAMLAVLFAGGREPATSQRYTVVHWGVDAGLPNNALSDVIQTSVDAPPPNYFGTLFNLSETDCFTLANPPAPIACRQVSGSQVDLIGLVGGDAGLAINHLTTLGYRVIRLCTIDGAVIPNGIVTAAEFAVPFSGPQLYGAGVNLHYKHPSCPE
jgi:hypothetical protein